MLALDRLGSGTHALARDEVLFRRGDKTTAVYFVEAGRLRLERRTFDGRLLILYTAHAGEFFAEASLFSDVYHCDAVAVEPSRVRIYPKAAILDVLHNDPESALSFLAVIARQLHALRHRLELRNVRSAKERVMLFLEFNAGPDGRTWHSQGQLQDIAMEVGLTREAVYRTLAGLERAEMIERADDRIVIKKPLRV